ncbi:MAG: hypothetical protein A3G32_06165 [Deltaproteobacteria bacterium RIFCSPLOWO2_12_FULL_40_28]|nr:MAG: hypothetical protein A3C45_02260 [Deltaproteobacteria bacterium RIFCSPHIGHO2_02_FULL_40_28]OGQ19039.1 MAG: hypothetical protein A3E27_05350 [Deltaproteobacteria bacterium RIFCSPHIGHO2_12_FULL_40_32]OGQ40211.1 MAG: hypothetical protein A3I69_00790 [Deltaproteobacteria bacterium RIFCSPLOWO2_02_FULL_40_36]OGQ53482.1 MAG: hypothetical protein A3G32_06165 [Deltaproteobacteria bacterium RIFCSPLOWO2_12_FULL_40_28]
MPFCHLRAFCHPRAGGDPSLNLRWIPSGACPREGGGGNDRVGAHQMPGTSVNIGNGWGKLLRDCISTPTVLLFFTL